MERSVLPSYSTTVFNHIERFHAALNLKILRVHVVYSCFAVVRFGRADHPDVRDEGQIQPEEIREADVRFNHSSTTDRALRELKTDLVQTPFRSRAISQRAIAVPSLDACKHRFAPNR